MFSSTLVKLSLCAILASVVRVTAQSAANVTCGNLPTAPLDDCEDVVQTLHNSNEFFLNNGGQANFEVGSCMGRVLFDFPINGGIDAGTFATNLEPILAKCGSSDPMSGETLPPSGGNKYELFNPSVAQ